MNTSFQSSRACNSAISAADRSWSNRARAIGCSLETETLIDIPRRAPAAFQSAATPLPGQRLTARTFELYPNSARVLAAVTRWGRTGFLNFCRRLAGSSFLPLVHACKQPSGIYRILFRPHLSLLTVHAPKHERSFLKCLTNALKGQSL